MNVLTIKINCPSTLSINSIINFLARGTADPLNTFPSSRQVTSQGSEGFVGYMDYGERFILLLRNYRSF